MRIDSRTTPIAVLLLSCAYIALFVPPNLTGAKNRNMLAAFQIDEYSQYPAVMTMTSPGPSLSATLKNIVVYHHYYYGYPYFVASALSILPLKVFFQLAAGDGDATTAYMVVLRQLSPFFMVLAIALLTYMWTGFKSFWRSILLLLFLASIPAVFANNLWWHPDSLATLFVVLTILSLYTDDLAFRRWFYLAAVFCGLATGTKLIGLWFCVTMAVYLVLGLRRIGMRACLIRAAAFVSLMVLTIVITNPLLLVPQTARQIMHIQATQAAMNAFGWGVRMSKGPVAWYASVLKNSYGHWLIYLVALAGCVLGIVRNSERRLLNVIVLTWSLPLSLFLLFGVANKASRYFLPTLVPMLSCLGNEVLWTVRQGNRMRLLRSAGATLIFAVLALQLASSVRLDVRKYRATLQREETSPALEFYRRVAESCLERPRTRPRLRVFRDPYVYVPPLTNVDTFMKWGSADYADIDRIRPDLILLEHDFIATYSNPHTVEVSLDQAQAARSLAFYRDAKQDAIRGYEKVVETRFGTAFVRRE
jgi:hypothetical protein